MIAPSAVGTLAETPLAHGLIYARNRRLSGRLELNATDSRSAVIVLWRGRITAVEMMPPGMCPGGYFGAVVYELGMVSASILDATLLDIAQTRRLHGDVLVERGAITTAQRDEALVEQVHRKIHYLFSFPATTAYAFYDAKMIAGDPPIAVDPIGPVWRGIRDYPPTTFVEETIRRIGSNVLRVTAGGSARLPPAETALATALATHPMTIAEMKSVTELPPPRVEQLVYLLVIAKCIEAVSGARTYPSTGALPIHMPSGPVHGISGEVRRASGPMIRPTSAPPGTSSSPSPFPRTSVVPGAMPPISRTIPSTRGSAIPRTSSVPAPPAGTLAALQSPADLGLEGVIARAAAIEDEDYYQVLGVANGASSEAVRAAYMRLVKTWHPDRLHADFIPIRGDVATVFTRMTRAYQTLCDPDGRRAYEASRKALAQAAARPRADVVRAIQQEMGRRNFDVVVQLCQELIDADAEDVEALAIQAWASVRGGDAAEGELRSALATLDKIVNMDRTDDQAAYHRALVHKRLGNMPAAIRDFARAVQLNPKHVEAEREIRIIAMRVRKGSGEHKLVGPLLEKLGKK